ncbi:MAG: hypothetical protein AAF211_15435 [Myxococcota bacterium]
MPRGRDADRELAAASPMGFREGDRADVVLEHRRELVGVQHGALVDGLSRRDRLQAIES